MNPFHGWNDEMCSRKQKYVCNLKICSGNSCWCLGLDTVNSGSVYIQISSNVTMALSFLSFLFIILPPHFLVNVDDKISSIAHRKIILKYTDGHDAGNKNKRNGKACNKESPRKKIRFQTVFDQIMENICKHVWWKLSVMVFIHWIAATPYPPYGQIPLECGSFLSGASVTRPPASDPAPLAGRRKEFAATSSARRRKVGTRQTRLA